MVVVVEMVTIAEIMIRFLLVLQVAVALVAAAVVLLVVTMDMVVVMVIVIVPQRLEETKMSLYQGKILIGLESELSDIDCGDGSAVDILAGI